MKRRDTDCPMLPTRRITLRLGELQTGLSRCNIHWNKLYYMEQIYLSNGRKNMRKQIAQGVMLHQAYVQEQARQEALALEGLQAYTPTEEI